MNFLIIFVVLIKFVIDCNAVEVKTSCGVVKGHSIQVLNQTVNEFLGIPFAEPPIGDLRFAKPKPIDKPLNDVIDATKPKNSCIQLFALEFGDGSDFVGNLTQSEDCLFLNIWSQSSNTNSSKLKPVMFWIYGGGLTVGSIYQSLYNGSVLATKDVVFVSTNYRLGPFGFLYGNDSTAPANVGFYDQNLALKWVRDNIHLFGGDKDQITLFGESAGSWSVSAHLLSPESKGLFKRAILQSGSIMFNKDRPILSASEALSNAKEMTKELDCRDNITWLSCLRKVDHEQLVKLYKMSFFKQLQQTEPVFGTEFLPLLPQKAFEEKKFNKDLDLMAGVTRDEGSQLSYLMYLQDLHDAKLTKTNFTLLVNISNRLLHNFPVENITEFYLKGVDLNDSEAIKWKFYDFFGDALLKCPTYLFAKRYAEQSVDKSRIFFYEQTYTIEKASEKMFGVAHGADVPLVFGLPIIDNTKYSKQDIEFSHTFINYWTNFAKHGTPDSGETWKSLISGNNNLELIKDLNPTESKLHFIGLFDKTCNEFWRDYYGIN